MWLWFEALDLPSYFPPFFPLRCKIARLIISNRFCPILILSFCIYAQSYTVSVAFLPFSSFFLLRCSVTLLSYLYSLFSVYHFISIPQVLLAELLECFLLSASTQNRLPGVFALQYTPFVSVRIAVHSETPYDIFFE